MKDVKNPLVVSEYYPRILPPGACAAPVTRLTPHFHDIVFQNITATGAAMAGAIVGLPEAPVTDIVLQKRQSQRRKGIVDRLCNRDRTEREGQAAQGDAIIKMPGANVTSK